MVGHFIVLCKSFFLFSKDKHYLKDQNYAYTVRFWMPLFYCNTSACNMWTQQADVFAKYFRNLDTPQGKNVLFTNFDAEYQSLFYVFTPNNFEQGSYSKFYTKCKPVCIFRPKYYNFCLKYRPGETWKLGKY